MSDYIPNCRGVNCAYCSSYADESNWIIYDEDVHFGECNAFNDITRETYWKYEDFSLEQLILEFHGDSTITACKDVVANFYENIFINHVPANSLKNFEILCSAGCYMKLYITELIKAYPTSENFNMNDLINSGSVKTNMYYYNVVGMNYEWVLGLFISKRFDVLDDLNDRGCFSQNPVVFSILYYFNLHKMSVSDDMMYHLIEYFGIEKIITTSMDVCSINMAEELVKYQPWSTNLDHSDSKVDKEPFAHLQANIDRFFIQPNWNVGSVTISDITKVISSGVFNLIMNVLKHLVLNAESREATIRKNAINVYELASLNYFRSDLYEHLIAAILLYSS
jgi:hypothetical protein